VRTVDRKEKQTNPADIFGNTRLVVKADEHCLQKAGNNRIIKSGGNQVAQMAKEPGNRVADDERGILQHRQEGR
jgi:hypothetical protein